MIKKILFHLQGIFGLPVTIKSKKYDKALVGAIKKLYYENVIEKQVPFSVLVRATYDYMTEKGYDISIFEVHNFVIEVVEIYK